MAKGHPDKLIAISKNYPFEKTDLNSMKDADKLIDPIRSDVYLLHGGEIYRAKYNPAWGFIPKELIKKSHPRYADISEKF